MTPKFNLFYEALLAILLGKALLDLQSGDWFGWFWIAIGVFGFVVVLVRIERDRTRRNLIDAGFAHYDARTGDWVLNADAEGSE